MGTLIFVLQRSGGCGFELGRGDRLLCQPQTNRSNASEMEKKCYPPHPQGLVCEHGFVFRYNCLFPYGRNQKTWAKAKLPGSGYQRSIRKANPDKAGKYSDTVAGAGNLPLPGSTTASAPDPASAPGAVAPQLLLLPHPPCCSTSGSGTRPSDSPELDKDGNIVLNLVKAPSPQTALKNPPNCRFNDQPGPPGPYETPSLCTSAAECRPVTQ